MSLTSLKVVKDNKSGNFYLVGPGFLKVKVTDGLENAWKELEASYSENITFLKEAGLEDEVDQFNFKKAFTKAFWLESLTRGLIIIVPIFFGFFLFSYAITGQFTKLASKIQDVIKPYSDKAVREQAGYKATLERYRPYIFETLKVVKEENIKAEDAVKITLPK